MRVSLLFFILTELCACGVKGDPLPPEKPVELGRGRPTYKRATEGIKVDRKLRKAVEERDQDKDGETDED
jgi:hypothetical protein